MDRVKEARNKFSNVTFNHAFIELNEKADKLSKEALLPQEV